MPEKTYHLFNRAAGSEKLFKSHDNYFYFLKKYAEHISIICDTWSYCLLPNHFHLLIRIKSFESIIDQYKLLKHKEVRKNDNLLLSDFIMERFSNWLNGYTKAFNKSYQRKGSLFIDYTKRSLVETDNSFTKVIHYVHANPVHHGYVEKTDQWNYSSYASIISHGKTRLLRDEILE